MPTLEISDNLKETYKAEGIPEPEFTEKLSYKCEYCQKESDK